jgi:MarR family 2-MHQ and catechol resistance regulon transcriptional repressor
MPTHYSGNRAQVRTLDTFIKLTRCTNAVLARLSDRQTIGALTPSQFAVLEALFHLGSMTAGQLSAKVLKSGSDLTTVVDHLERDALVGRGRQTADRRVIVVHLTKAGKKKIEALLPAHVAGLVDEFSVLTAGEQESLGELCKKLGKGKERSK